MANVRFRCTGPLAALSIALVAEGQESRTVQVSDSPVCATCQVVLDTVAVLGAADGPAALGGGVPPTVRRDKLGRFWVFGSQAEPVVFSAAGAFVRVVGRQGRGPGEFLSAGDGVAVGDSMIVLDAIMRATVVGPDLSPGRLIRMPRPLAPGLALRWPDSVVLQGEVGSAAAVGWPLHLTSFATEEVELVRSFGPDRGELRPGEAIRLQQHLTARVAGGFWSADWRRYRIHEWSAELSRTRTFVRTPDWFAVESAPWIGNKTTPPPPVVAGVTEDSNRLLWIAINLPANSWRSAWPDYPEGTREIRGAVIRFEQLYRTVIEAVDPSRAQVVTRRTIEGYVASAMSDGLMMLYTLDRDDTPRLVIVRPRLVTSGASSHP